MTDFEQILHCLHENGVQFVVIGAVASAAHGSTHSTFDIDICYARNRANLHRLAQALADTRPRPRDLPEGLPFVWDASTLQSGTNFTLSTSLGWVDLLGEVTGLGAYPEVERYAISMKIYGVPCRVLSLDGLILAKRAAGRPKDMAHLEELEALRELRERSNSED